jgi:hypothetical protein
MMPVIGFVTVALILFLVLREACVARQSRPISVARRSEG